MPGTQHVGRIAMCTRRYAAPMLELGILGPLLARVNGREVALGGPRQRAVLAVLLLHRNTVVSADRLVDLVWGEDPPPTAATALQNHVSRLRLLLGPESIETRAPGYLLRTGPTDVDVDRFEILVAQAGVAPPHIARGRLREALGLIRGPVLADVASEPFAEVETARLEELRLAALEARIEADLAVGEHEAVVPELEALVAQHPYRERLHAQRMLALYRVGRQADALAAYQSARAALDEGLGIDPGPDLQALEVRVLRQDPTLAAPASAARPVGNLPAPATPLVGRTRELREVRELLTGVTAVVTITGPGGIGKTRLALEVARTLAGDQEAGGWFVDLATSTSAAQAIVTIQAVLGVPDSPDSDELRPLREFLAGRRLLLLLDNLEQVLNVAAPLAALVATTPGLRVLATSRAPLAIGAEREYPLTPLAAGLAGEAVDVDALPDAVMLFVERARAVSPGFWLTPAAAPQVAELCRRLDGLPLAIELAAARVRLLTPAAILERISQGLEVLRSERRDLPARQQSMEAAIAWSYDLLGTVTQRAFRRTAVFASGFTLEAFGAVCCEPGEDALTALSELVEHSLVERQDTRGDEARYAMLDTIAQFALQRFEATPDTEVRARHMRQYLALARTVGPSIGGTGEVPRLAALRVEHDNLRAALEWLATSGSADDLVELVAAASPFWVRGSQYREGRTWITQALAADGAGSVRARAIALRNLSVIESTLGNRRPAMDRAAASVAAWELDGDGRGLADALRVEAMAATDVGDLATAREAARRAIEVAGAVGDDRAARGARHEMAFLAAQDGDLDAALALLEENAVAMKAASDRLGLAATLGNIGDIQRERGAFEVAEAASRQAIEILRTQIDAASISSVLATLAQILVETGRLVEAAEAATEGLTVAWQSGALRELPPALDVLGGIRLLSGDAPGAVELLAASAMLRDPGAPPPVGGLAGTALNRAREALDPAVFETAWRAGSATPLDRIVELALGLAW